MSISVVFPMYNERNYVKKCVALVIEAVKEIANDYEIIIVDDCSIDDSGRIVDDIARQNPLVKVIHNQKNRKLGGSLKSGFQLASKEYVLYSDIDMPFDFKEIRKAFDLLLIQDAEIVSAYRINKGADGAKRYIYSFVYNVFIRLLFGLKVKDINFSFKVIKNSFLKKNMLISEGSFINAELFIRAKRCAAKITQFPVVYFPRQVGVSRLSSLAVIIKIVQEALYFRLGLLKNGK